MASQKAELRSKGTAYSGIAVMQILDVLMLRYIIRLGAGPIYNPW